MGKIVMHKETNTVDKRDKHNLTKYLEVVYECNKKRLGELKIVPYDDIRRRPVACI